MQEGTLEASKASSCQGRLTLHLPFLFLRARKFTTAKANRQSLWVLEGKAHVEGKLVAQAEIKLMLQPVFAENSTDV